MKKPGMPGFFVSGESASFLHDSIELVD